MKMFIQCYWHRQRVYRFRFRIWLWFSTPASISPTIILIQEPSLIHTPCWPLTASPEMIEFLDSVYGQDLSRRFLVYDLLWEVVVVELPPQILPCNWFFFVHNKFRFPWKVLTTDTFFHNFSKYRLSVSFDLDVRWIRINTFCFSVRLSWLNVFALASFLLFTHVFTVLLLSESRGNWRFNCNVFLFLFHRSFMLIIE